MRTTETRLEQVGAIMSVILPLLFSCFSLPLCGCIYWRFVLSNGVDIDVNHSTGQKSLL